MRSGCAAPSCTCSRVGLSALGIATWLHTISGGMLDPCSWNLIQGRTPGSAVLYVPASIARAVRQRVRDAEPYGPSVTVLGWKPKPGPTVPNRIYVSCEGCNCTPGLEWCVRDE